MGQYQATFFSKSDIVTFFYYSKYCQSPLALLRKMGIFYKGHMVQKRR